MGQRVIEVRGYTFAVEAKSGTQLAFIKEQMEKRSNLELEGYEMEYLLQRSETN
jgi:hypothetical protein